jgi:hypothetical protein
MVRRRKREELTIEEQLQLAKDARERLEAFRAKVDRARTGEIEPEPVQSVVAPIGEGDPARNFGLAKEGEPIPLAAMAGMAYGLRLAGFQDEDIAAQLQVGVSLVQKLIRDQAKASLARNVSDPDIARAVELDQIQALIKALWKMALSGDLAAVDRVERLVKRRSELSGVSTMKAPTPPEQNTDYSRLTKDELDTLKALETKLLGPGAE